MNVYKVLLWSIYSDRYIIEIVTCSSAVKARELVQAAYPSADVKMAVKLGPA